MSERALNYRRRYAIDNSIITLGIHSYVKVNISVVLQR